MLIIGVEDFGRSKVVAMGVSRRMIIELDVSCCGLLLGVCSRNLI
jgi:hypothetical protein